MSDTTDLPATPDLTIDCATLTWAGVETEGIFYSEYVSTTEYSIAVATAGTGYDLAIPEESWFIYDAHSNSATAYIDWAVECPAEEEPPPVVDEEEPPPPAEEEVVTPGDQIGGTLPATGTAPGTFETLGLWAMLAIGVILFVVVMAILRWRRDRKPARRTPSATAEVTGSIGVGDLPEFMKIIPSSQATDIGTYAMMKSLETGEPVHVYEDDDGTWRDGTTNEVIERG